MADSLFLKKGKNHWQFLRGLVPDEKNFTMIFSYFYEYEYEWEYFFVFSQRINKKIIFLRIFNWTQCDFPNECVL